MQNKVEVKRIWKTQVVMPLSFMSRDLHREMVVLDQGKGPRHNWGQQ